MNIKDLIPDPEDLLALPPEDLAGHVLREMIRSRQSKFNSHNFAIEAGNVGYPQEFAYRVQRALMEAWAYLEREVFIAPDPDDPAHGWFFVTRRGNQLQTKEDYRSFRHAGIFPKTSIHSLIVERCYSSFLLGDYETAVFKAFKTVEVRVREVSKYDSASLGVDLARKAFHPQTGPLTDLNEPVAEREALQGLFAGALGRFKNPSSHRHVAMTDAAQTVELLQLASHLLRIVDDRTRPDVPETT